jgi:aspartyl-tRNA(Asn)/glutamyl-tRNA(Gln) amidotransferase subunit B
MAVSEEVKRQYKPTIGIECHVQLKTKTKLFSAVGNDARAAAPNTLISHIDVGLPGALPVLNEKAIELAARAAFALNTAPQKFSKFDRKHYFYPDLPKGYQITQYEDPIIKEGSVEILVGEDKKKIEVTRIHLEEDAGKNIHPEGADYSLVDLNRAGTPLLEVVSEPQINSPAEAKAYARELYLLMKYADVSDVDLYHGNMRFDVNISVSKEEGKLGKRAEVKNLNSFRSIENAVRYEIDRQIGLLEKGESIVQETRGWDEAKQKTTAQRGKEEAHDYRYMPEPDIPPVELDQAWIDNVKKSMPALPPQIREMLNKLSISDKSIEALLDRNGEYGLNYFQRIEEGKKYSNELAEYIAKYIVNDYFKIISDIKKMTDDAEPTSPYLPTVDQFAEIYDLISEGKITSNSAVMLLFNSKTFPEGTSLAKQAEELSLIQVSDESEIEKIVAEVLDQNPQAAQDIRNGEMKAVGFLVGQVMAKSRGQANPQVAQQLIKKQLGL